MADLTPILMGDPRPDRLAISERILKRVQSKGVVATIDPRAKRPYKRSDVAASQINAARRVSGQLAKVLVAINDGHETNAALERKLKIRDRRIRALTKEAIDCGMVSRIFIAVGTSRLNKYAITDYGKAIIAQQVAA